MMGAGLIGFLVVLALVVAAVFLFRSMNRHLRKVPPSFEAQPFEAEPADAESLDPPAQDETQPPAG